MEHYYNGILYVNTDKGIAIFTHDKGRLLRITHLPTPMPDDSFIDVVAISNVTSYTPLTKAEVDNWFDKDEEDRRSGEVCRPCRRIHSPGDYAKWGPFTFINGHEYRVWTKTDRQTYPRSFRMQFMGRGPSQFKYQLTFNARGPERSTKGNFAGTQQVDARNFIKVEEVDRNPAERYTERIEKS